MRVPLFSRHPVHSVGFFYVALLTSTMRAIKSGLKIRIVFFLVAIIESVSKGVFMTHHLMLTELLRHSSHTLIRMSLTNQLSSLLLVSGH